MSEKEKGLMDMDNSVVIAGGRGYKGTKWQWKKKIQLKEKEKKELGCLPI